MKIITLLTVIAIVLLQLSGAIPNASVGGPMTIMLILLIAMLAVGIHEARLNKRGALGGIVNIVVCVIGGFVAAGFFGGVVMDTVLPLLRLEGSLASSGHPLLYVAYAGMALFTLLGSWLALQIVNRFR